MNLSERLQRLIDGSPVYDTATIREAKAEIERLKDRLRNIEHCAALVCDSWVRYGDVGAAAFAALSATLSKEVEG